MWFLNRGTGIVLLVLMTLSVLLGILSARSRAGRGTPGFVRNVVHRNVALLAMAMLTVHVVSAVVDSYVDIRWWDAVVPWGGLYQPVWLGLGALAFDLLLAVALTSLLRTRLPHAAWRLVHWASYLAWAVAVIHGFGIGTDSDAQWSVLITAGCVLAVALALALRIGGVVRTAVRA
ncbi:MAG: ferric reductase-like transmembrane domain-containing protein [Propionibacteriaceae bacterium]|nr:ferric reductase-like transmembrane domain-containing protein [Propionibacteriaceae bacterium]